MTRTAPRQPPRVLTAALVAVIAVLLGLLGAGCGSGATGNTAKGTNAAATVATRPRIIHSSALSPRDVPTVSVGGPLAVHPVDAGFLGISLDYYAVTQYAGDDPDALNPLFLRLVRNLNPGQKPVLRIGGDSTDWAWLPTPGVKRVGGLKERISATDLRVLSAVTRALNAKLILGINLEADSARLARHLADTLVAAVGASHVEALELGNEPDLYDVLGWYANRAGAGVLGRPAGYSLADYTREFDAIARVLPHIGLAGPASGAASWVSNLSGFVRHATRLKLVTVHAYPSETCGTHPGLATYPTIPTLIAPSSTRGLAEGLEPAARAAGAGHAQIRVDELNSVACFGAKGVSNTYAAALWSIETAFQFARLGFSGFNLTTVPSAEYRLWAQHHGTATVSPEYYGLLDFADSVPAGSRVLATPDGADDPQVFAVRTPAGQTHVVVVNAGASRRIAVRISGAHDASGIAAALVAPSLAATSGVTLAGQSFGPGTSTGDATRTGTLTGRARAIRVRPVAGRYVLALPAHSAVTLSAG